MKGKHAKAAANRQDRQELVDAAEQANLRAARAEKERDEVLARAARQVEAAKRDATAAKRLLADGSSPEIERLRGEAERLRSERDAARQEAARVRDRWGKVTQRMVAHLVERESMAPLDAFGLLMGFAGAEGVTVLGDPTLTAAVENGRLTDEQARVIDRKLHGGYAV